MLCQKVRTLEQRLKGATEFAEDLRADGEVGIEDVRLNKRKSNHLADRMDLTADIMQGLVNDVASMKRQVLSTSASHMSNNLVIGGIWIEEEEEDPKQATIRFLENKLSIKAEEEDIIEAHCSKNTTERTIKKKLVTIPPVMFVHTSETLHKRILRSTWKLKSLKDDVDGYGYYVKQSMPEAYHAVRAKYQHDFDEIKEHNLNLKEGEKKIECWFSGDQFFKEGEIVQEKILTPTAKELINLSPEMLNKLDCIIHTTSTLQEAKHSMF